MEYRLITALDLEHDSRKYLTNAEVIVLEYRVVEHVLRYDDEHRTLREGLVSYNVTIRYKESPRRSISEGTRDVYIICTAVERRNEGCDNEMEGK
jgi:hypothetical protein